jgi:hypothetical protein
MEGMIVAEVLMSSSSMLPFFVPLCRIRPLGVLHQPCSLLRSIIAVLANLSDTVNDASQIASDLEFRGFYRFMSCAMFLKIVPSETR